MRPLAALAVSTLVWLTGCGGLVDGSTDRGYQSGGAVDGPLLTSRGKAEDGMFAQVEGRLSSKGDCLRLRGMPVVWPEGTSWDADAAVLTLPGGEAVAVGGRVSGGGGYLGLRAIRTLFGEEVADAARPCLGPTEEVAVFNPGWAVSRAPSAP